MKRLARLWIALLLGCTFASAAADEPAPPSPRPAASRHAPVFRDEDASGRGEFEAFPLAIELPPRYAADPNGRPNPDFGMFEGADFRGGRAGLPLVNPPIVVPPAGLRMPGEFERQDLVLLAYNDLATMYPDLFLSMLRALRTKVRVLVLLGEGQAEFLDELLAEHDLAGLKVERAEVAHDTMWVRDYGPVVVKGKDGRRTAVDLDYLQFGRPLDDAVPPQVAGRERLDVLSLAVDLEGGNLLSNGAGLLLSTTTCLDVNLANGVEEPQLRKYFQQFFGGEVLFLEPLENEDTGHVDMFAAFLSADTVVVGAYDLDVDPVNAALLDRNAERLSRVVLPGGRKLRVFRIPMPANDDGVWRTYTNIVMVNGLVLVPVYPEVDPDADRIALATYRTLLRGWQVAPIEASEVIESGGALHCLTMNIPSAAAGPALRPSPRPAPRVRPVIERLTRRRPRTPPSPPAG